MSSDNSYNEKLGYLAQQDIGQVTHNALMRDYSYWKIGGPADCLIEPGSLLELRTSIRIINKLGLPHVVIGEGSNLLFDDAGVRGVILRIGRNLNRIQANSGSIEVEAGVYVPRLARYVGSMGLSGLEHIVGIPGTLGGLLIMNGGSMRKSISSCVESVTVIDSCGELKEVPKDECGFSYRHSNLKDHGEIIYKAKLTCFSGDKKEIRQAMLGIMRTRRKKFPQKQPSCGSVFLADQAVYDSLGAPGKIIEDAGLKGLRIGGAQVSPMHANFIVNIGHARSEDILNLVFEIIETVRKKFNYSMKCEVKYVNKDCALEEICF